MKKQLQNFTFRAWLLLAVSLFLITSCKKNGTEEQVSGNDKGGVPEEIKSMLKAGGFDVSQGLSRVAGGYIVEYDIFLTADQIRKLDSPAPKKFSKSPSTKHWVTNNLVQGVPNRVLKVYIDNSFSTYIQNSFDAALARYNNLNIKLSFQRVLTASDADIKITPFYAEPDANGLVLGVGSFPTSNGNPGSTITLNTYKYNSSYQGREVTTTIMHEIGHTIGFRHTDWQDRRFSCGPNSPVINEGLQTYGANYVWDTPYSAAPGSWMLACSNALDRPFTPNDITALTNTYTFPYPNGYLVREQNGTTVYVLYGGAKFPIPTEQVLVDLYGGWNHVHIIPDGYLANITSTPQNFTKLREQNSNAVYVIFGGAKFEVPSQEVLNTYYGGSTNIFIVPDGTLSAVPNTPRPGVLLHEINGITVYYIENGMKRPIANTTVLDSFGGWTYVIKVPDNSLNHIPNGPQIN